MEFFLRAFLGEILWMNCLGDRYGFFSSFFFFLLPIFLYKFGCRKFCLWLERWSISLILRGYF